MKQSNPKLSIPKPCHENWDKMNSMEKGRFCDVCSKTVIDFTQMKTEEIIAFIGNSKENVCGRLNTKVLANSDKVQYANYFRRSISFLFFGFILMFINACTRTQGNIEVNHSDVDNIEDSLNSKPRIDSSKQIEVPAKVSRDSIKKIKDEPTIKGKIKIQTELMGDISIVDPEHSGDSM